MHGEVDLGRRKFCGGIAAATALFAGSSLVSGCYEKETHDRPSTGSGWSLEDKAQYDQTVWQYDQQGAVIREGSIQLGGSEILFVPTIYNGISAMFEDFRLDYQGIGGFLPSLDNLDFRIVPRSQFPSDLDRAADGGLQRIYTLDGELLNATMYIADDLHPITSINVTLHEIGHFFERDSEETTSQATELYLSIFMASQYPLIGAKLLDMQFGAVKTNGSDDYPEYDIGHMSGVYNLLVGGGHLPQVLKSYIPKTNNDLEAEYETMLVGEENHKTALLHEWNRIFEQGQLEQYLIQDGINVGELVQFMQLLNLRKHGFIGSNRLENEEEFVAWKERFLSQTNNPSMTSVLRNY